MPPRPWVTAAAAALTTALICAAAPANAAGPLALPTTFVMPVDVATGAVTTLPTSGDAIPNVDVVKSTIRAYYRATGGVADKSASPYLSEVKEQLKEIDYSYPALPTAERDTKAIVFDTDDTLLWNYDFEDKATSFNYDPAVNAAWVSGTSASCEKFNGFCFPAVPGTPSLLKDLTAKGYRLYVITGRPSSQEAATVDNLAAAGFTDADGDPLFTAANVYTKWATSASTYDAAEVPDYVRPANGGQCSTFVDTARTQFKCTTVEYKAQTRQHIEDADGVEIVGNVGDQLSDLWGGYADRAWKIPNPTYFLSSPNLDAAHVGQDDQSAELTLPASYAMAADGSSGTSVDGDAIPNIDVVRTEIRAWYNATNGIADKTSSRFLTELAGLTTAWTSSTVTDCARQSLAISRATAAKQAAATTVTKARRALTKATATVAKARKKLARSKKHSSAAVRHQRAHQLRAAKRALTRARAGLAAAERRASAITVPNRPAITLDADDTTLWNYDMEDGAMKFAYTPAVAADWVLGKRFPAEPGMVSLVRQAKAAGCTVIGVTGRPREQADATVANLTQAGFVDARGAALFTPSLYFTKWPTSPSTYDAALVPSYITGSNCSTFVDTAKTQFKCTTVEYKSATRAHIERDLHYTIVGNFGDQYSDLIGGHALRTYKLPNPTYYLP